MIREMKGTVATVEDLVSGRVSDQHLFNLKRVGEEPIIGQSETPSGNPPITGEAMISQPHTPSEIIPTETERRKRKAAIEATTKIAGPVKKRLRAAAAIPTSRGMLWI